MRAVDLVIVVDNKIRDLTGCVLLKRKLEERGLSVRLCPNGHEYEMLFYRPKAILHNHMREGHKSRIGALQKKVAVLAIVTPTENIMRENRDVEQLYVGKFWCDFSNIDTYIAWGEVIRDVLIQDCGMNPDRVVALGNVRTDLFCPPFHRKKEIREIKTVLYTSSHQYGSWNHDVAVEKLVGCDFDKLTSFTVEEYYEEDRRAFSAYLASIRAAIARFPHLFFIVKPHPFEDFQPYRELESQMADRHSNFRVEYTASSNQVIHEADLLIHAGTVASIEAWFLGIPTLGLHYFERKSCHYPEMMAGSVVVSSEDMLFDYLQNVDRLKADFAGCQMARDRYIRRWLTTVDGRRCEEIAAFIQKRIADHPHPSALKIFSVMIGEYGLWPAIKHYLRYWRRGRTGQFLPRFSEAHRQKVGEQGIQWTLRKVFTPQDLQKTESYISTMLQPGGQATQQAALT